MEGGEREGETGKRREDVMMRREQGKKGEREERAERG
jgi:hypothetical protein